MRMPKTIIRSGHLCRMLSSSFFFSKMSFPRPPSNVPARLPRPRPLSNEVGRFLRALMRTHSTRISFWFDTGVHAHICVTEWNNYWGSRGIQVCGDPQMFLCKSGTPLDVCPPAFSIYRRLRGIVLFLAYLWSHKTDISLSLSVLMDDLSPSLVGVGGEGEKHD